MDDDITPSPSEDDSSSTLPATCRHPGWTPFFPPPLGPNEAPIEGGVVFTLFGSAIHAPAVAAGMAAALDARAGLPRAMPSA